MARLGCRSADESVTGIQVPRGRGPSQAGDRLPPGAKCRHARWPKQHGAKVPQEALSIAAIGKPVKGIILLLGVDRGQKHASGAWFYSGTLLCWHSQIQANSVWESGHPPFSRGKMVRIAGLEPANRLCSALLIVATTRGWLPTLIRRTPYKYKIF